MINFDDDFSEIAAVPTSGRDSNIIEGPTVKLPLIQKF